MAVLGDAAGPQKQGASHVIGKIEGEKGIAVMPCQQDGIDDLVPISFRQMEEVVAGISGDGENSQSRTHH